jgi:large subunit ribosomal protein L14e
MMEVGRLCVKLAGRDAGKKCVIVDVLDSVFVLIDGETRRRKCNLKHLEPLKETIDIKKSASHEAVVSAFKELGIEIKETKPKQPKPRQKQIRAADRKKLAPKTDKKESSSSGRKVDSGKNIEAVKQPKSKTAKKSTKLEKTLDE